MRFAERLLRDEHGTSLIEMAMIAPFLASLIIGMTDLSRGYAAKLQLEQAAQRSIEKAMNGDKETELFETLKAEAAAAAQVPEDDVEVRYWLECNGVSQNSDPATMKEDYEDKVCPNGQTIARYVNVRIEKSYTPLFRLDWLGANADGTFTLVGESGIRVQ